MDFDELLVQKAKDGDNDAFVKLYEKVYKDMYKYAYYMLGNEADAEDIISETVVDMYTGIKKLKNLSLFRSWCFKILSNKCKRKRKSYLKKNVSIEECENNVDLSYEYEPCKYHDLEVAFSGLSEEEKNIVTLSAIFGYKSIEVGEILNLKNTTVRSKLSRELSKMKKVMEI